MSVVNHALRRILNNRILGYWLKFEIILAGKLCFTLSLLILNSILFAHHLGFYSRIRIIIGWLDNLNPWRIQVSKFQLLFNLIQCREVLCITKSNEKIVRFNIHSVIIANLLYIRSWLRSLFYLNLLKWWVCKWIRILLNIVQLIWTE